MKTVDILKEKRAAFKKVIARKEKDLLDDKRKYKALCIDVFKAETGLLEGMKVLVQSPNKEPYSGKIEGFTVMRSGDVVTEGWMINKDGKVGKRSFKTEVGDTITPLDKKIFKRNKIKWRL